MYTLADRELAQRIWDAPNAISLSKEDQDRGIALGFIVWPQASNLCNDVRHGHDVVTPTHLLCDECNTHVGHCQCDFTEE